MRRAILAGFLLVIVAGPAGQRADAGGGRNELPFALTARVREIDRGQAWVLLSDGTHLFALNTKQLEGIREGETVRVSGEERSGKKIILRIEPVPR